RLRRQPHARTPPVDLDHRLGGIGPELRNRPRRRFSDPVDGGNRHLCHGDVRRVVGLHFAASGRLLDRDVETTTDPILAARRTVNGLLVSVAGLIAVAVGNELVIAHPQSQVSMALSLGLFGGPSSWSSPSFVTGCDFKLARPAPAGLTAMPIDRPGLRCQYLRGSRTGVRPSTITRRSLPEIARNSATRNLTSPHDPTLGSPFHLLGCKALCIWVTRLHSTQERIPGRQDWNVRAL